MEGSAPWDHQLKEVCLVGGRGVPGTKVEYLLSGAERWHWSGGRDAKQGWRVRPLNPKWILWPASMGP